MANQTSTISGPSIDETVTRVITALDSVSGVTDPEQWLLDALNGGYDSATGVEVNEYKSLGWPMLYAAVGRVAGHISTMKMCLHRRSGNGRSEILYDDPRMKLLAHPNDWQSGVVQREQVQMHALLHGNGKLYVVRDATGMPLELIPLLPESARTLLVKGKKFHWVITPSYWDYTTSYFDPGHSYYLEDENCIHIQGLGTNGAWGYSIIHMMRDMVGLGLAGMKAAGNVFNNMGRPGIILEAPPGKFRDPKKAKEFLDKFDSSQAGLDRIGKTALLREGVTAKTLPISNSDAQFLESRKFSQDEAQLAIFLDVLIGGSGPYKSITEKNTAYLNNCLNRWVAKWEQEFDRKMLTEQEKEAGDLYWKLDTSKLVQGDPNTLADFTGKLRQQGAINGNEVREMHGLPKLDDPLLDTFSNPFTTSGDKVNEEEAGDDYDADSQPMVDEETNETEQMRKIARNAVSSRIKLLCNAERQRVVNMSQKANFEKTVANFYESWGASLDDVVQQLGGKSEDAYAYVTTSQLQLADIVSVTSEDQLPSVVTECVNDWDARHEVLVEQILSGAVTNA